MIRYKGDDIDFRISLKTGDMNISRWDELGRVCVYAYTNKSFIVKFDKCFTNEEHEEGFQPLQVLDDGLTISGRLTSENTKGMQSGFLTLEVLAEDTEGKSPLSAISIIKTDTRIADCQIKEEAR